MPTRAGWGVVGGSAIALGVGRLFAITELYVLAAVGLTTCALTLAAVTAARADLTVSRRMVPERMTVGQPGRIDLLVENRGSQTWLPCSLSDPVEGTLGVHLTVGPLSNGGHGAASYRLPTARRGRLAVGPLRADVVDPLGLARRRVYALPVTEAVILPRPLRTGNISRADGQSEPSASASGLASLFASPAEVATLRPYVVGDDLRRVHWPSSAHSGDLQVRSDEQHWQGQVAVLLDGRRATCDAAEFEQLVSTAAGLVHAAAANADQIRLTFTDGTDSGMVDAARAAPVLLEQLALVRQHDADATRWPLPLSRRDGHLLVISDPRGRQELTAVLAPLGYERVDIVSPGDASTAMTGHE